MIEGQSLFDQPGKNHIRKCHDILNITAGQAVDCTTGFLLFYTYFEHYKIIAMNLRKD